jgi:aspartokinase
VQSLVAEKPFLEEALEKGIINYGGLARDIRPKVEEELGGEASVQSIVMALSRLGEKTKLRNGGIPLFSFTSEIILKTSIADVSIARSPTLMGKMKSIYELADFDRGEVLSVILGSYEVTILISEKYRERLLSLLAAEKLLNVEKDLVSVSMSFPKDFLYTPGVLYRVVKELEWENINIFEIVSTLTELTFIVNKKDAMKSYGVLSQLTKARTD